MILIFHKRLVRRKCQHLSLVINEPINISNDGFSNSSSPETFKINVACNFPIIRDCIKTLNLNFLDLIFALTSLP